MNNDEIAKFLDRKRDDKGRFAAGAAGIATGLGAAGALSLSSAAGHFHENEKRVAQEQGFRALKHRHAMEDARDEVEHHLTRGKSAHRQVELEVLRGNHDKIWGHLNTQRRHSEDARQAARDAYSSRVKLNREARLGAGATAKAEQLAHLARGSKIAAGTLAVGTLGLGAVALRRHSDHVEKGLGTKVKNALDSVHITGQQARTAGAMGQVGGGAGAITGSLIGTGIGLATHHPAQGAGIGAAIGGAAGSSGGAALGLYAGRAKKPINRVAMPKKNEAQDTVRVHGKQSDYELAKNMTEGDLQRELAYNKERNRHLNRAAKKGAVVGAATGAAGGLLIAGKHGAALGAVSGAVGGALIGNHRAERALAKAFNANRTGRDAMIAGGSVGTAAGASAGLHALNGLRAKKAVNAGVNAAEHSANQIFKPGLTLSQRLTHGMKALDEGKKVAGVGETALASRAAMHTNLKVAGAGAALAGAGALMHAGTKPKTALAKSFDETKHKRGDAGKFVAIGSLAAGGLAGATGSVMSMAGHHSAKSFEERVARRVAEADRERALSQSTKGEESIAHIRRAIGARSSAVAMKGSADGARALREAGGRTALAGGVIMGAGLGAAALMHHHELKKSFDEAKHHRGHGGEFAAAGGAVVAGGGAGATGVQAGKRVATARDLGEKGRFWREGAGEFGRDASQASKLARANISFAESAASNTDTAHRKAHYLAQSRAWSLRAKTFAQNAQTEGARAGAFLHEASSAKRAALGHGGAAAGLGLAAGGLGALAVHEHMKKSFSHPTDEAQHHLAQAGLGVAAAADVAGASAAFKETKNAVKPTLEGLSTAKKIKAVAGYTKEKAAFPIVAGGIAATALAEHVMHNQQKTKPALSRPGQ